MDVCPPCEGIANWHCGGGGGVIEDESRKRAEVVMIE